MQVVGLVRSAEGRRSPGSTFKTGDATRRRSRDAGLVYGEIDGRRYSPNVAEGTSIGIMLAARNELVTSAQQVVKGSTVNLVVSNGNVKVPDLTRPVGRREAPGSTLTGSSLQLAVSSTPDPTAAPGSAVTSAVAQGDAAAEVRPSSSIYCNGGAELGRELEPSRHQRAEPLRALAPRRRARRPEPVAEHPVAALGEHRLRVELHAEHAARRGDAAP